MALDPKNLTEKRINFSFAYLVLNFFIGFILFGILLAGENEFVGWAFFYSLLMQIALVWTFLKSQLNLFVLDNGKQEINEVVDFKKIIFAVFSLVCFFCVLFFLR